MDRCPKCGYKLKITDLKPECPGCGVNLMYYDMQLRLENDAIKAAEENAVMQAFARKIVKSVIGSVTVILRLVMAVLTVISLLVPFAKTVTAGAGMEAGKSVGLINIIVAIIKGNAFSDGFTVVTVLFLVVLVLCLASLLISPFLFSKKALVGQTAVYLLQVVVLSICAASLPEWLELSGTVAVMYVMFTVCQAVTAIAVFDVRSVIANEDIETPSAEEILSESKEAQNAADAAKEVSGKND